MSSTPSKATDRQKQQNSNNSSTKKRRPNFRPFSQKSKSVNATISSTYTSDSQVAKVTTDGASSVSNDPQASTSPIDTRTSRADASLANQGKTDRGPDDRKSLSQASDDAQNDDKVPAPSTPEDQSSKVSPPNTATSSSSSRRPSVSRSTKRRKTGVEVGVSRASTRPPDSSPSTSIPGGTTSQSSRRESPFTTTGAAITGRTEQTKLLTERQAVFVTSNSTSTAPKLAAYCSRFRSKKKKKEKLQGVSGAKSPSASMPQRHKAEHQPSSNEKNASTSVGPVVQVVNGEIVLQQSSLVVSGTTTANNFNGQDDTSMLPIVEEEAHMAAVGASYNSFVTRRAPQHWTVEETKQFYEALRQVGTDFGVMEMYFKGDRTRKQLKRKYQIEMTKNPALVEQALLPAAKKEIGTCNVWIIFMLCVFLDMSSSCGSSIDMTVFKVTPNDIAAIETSKTATMKDANTTMVDGSRGALEPMNVIKHNGVSKQTAKDRSGDVIENENLSTSVEVRTKKRQSALEKDLVRGTSVWDDGLPEGNDKTQSESMEVDPLLQEEEEAAVSSDRVALVQNTAVSSQRKGRPRFRSRKRKTRAASSADK